MFVYRMRNATILVVRLKGVATEAIKNIVLAGIGKLIVVDSEDVAEEDLGASFFFRDDDVGKKVRYSTSSVQTGDHGATETLAYLWASAGMKITSSMLLDVAKPRIESLNPLVAVEALSDASALEGDDFDRLLQGVDMVCVTDCDRSTLIRLNEACRRLSKPFYAGGTYGLLGYIFCDLLQHDYIAPSGQKDASKNVKNTAVYVPLKTALQHRWTGMTRRQTKELNPAIVFAVLAVWEYQAVHQGVLPDDPSAAAELESIASRLIAEAQVNRQTLPSMPRELIDLATTAAHEISPVCAVVGGLLAQDILKALAAREPPIANFFTFDGTLGGGTVVRMSMP
ncbi:hypothetical protein BN946_scf184801.g46 [Trametes cinnabarina]|uniref:THIF-type NAD/FAD binding fold domain-containing protein n=1 Tax=Pycnoporus cinnabarinus TaxID=5643 RepID=A0A060SEP8_PYCCI|nr:hypothetical protein BN946_scf184801.g46 [Trametes cinnabarina]